jgi:flagellar basal body rod protein FlgG
MISALSSALHGITSSLRRMDRAANSIARSGLSDVPVGPNAPAASPGPPEGAEATDLPGAMVDMLMAQRAFSAQLRVLRTAEEMSRETTGLLKR